MVDATSSLPDDPHDPHDPHGVHPRPPQSLTVDCDGCRVRGPSCADCVVTVLLGPPRRQLELDADERSALAALAGAGLVPPLRLVRAVDPDPPQAQTDGGASG